MGKRIFGCSRTVTCDIKKREIHLNPSRYLEQVVYLDALGKLNS
jgi:hypothetical protein